MTRRTLFGWITKSTALFGSGGSLFFALRSRTFIVRDYYVSRRFPETQFATSQDFWSSHYDEMGDKTNSTLLQSKHLLSKRSFLLSDQKTIVVEQVFKNKASYLFRERVKSLLRAEFPENNALHHIQQDTEFLT